MTRREKTLGLLALVPVVAAGLYYGANALVLEPAAKLEQRARGLASENRKLQRVNDNAYGYRRKIQDMALHTFGTDEKVAGAAVCRHLRKLLGRSRLTWDKLQPTRGRVRKDAYREISVVITAYGSLGDVVNFLYLLNDQPNLFKVQNLAVRPTRQDDQVSLTMRYTTLVLDPGPKEHLVTRPVVEETLGNLSASARGHFDVIVNSKPFSPYRAPRRVASTPPRRRERPREDPPRQDPPRQAPPARTPPPSSYEKVVGLPEFADGGLVVLRDVRTGAERTLEPGKELQGGRIVMVDYRDLPDPGDPKLLSPSRVILQMEKGKEYWAIELGGMVSQRRILKKSELPPALRAEGASSDASGPSRKNGKGGQS